MLLRIYLSSFHRNSPVHLIKNLKLLLHHRALGHNYENIYARGEGDMCAYSRNDATAPWEKELGIFQTN